MIRFALSAFFALCAFWAFFKASNWPHRVLDDAALQYTTPSVPAEANGDITYFSMVENQNVTVDGAAAYLRDHHWGWEECRDYFIDNATFEGQTLWNAPDQNPMVPANIIHASGHVIDAYRDGWARCQFQIQQELKTTSESSFRQDLVVPQTRTITILYGLSFGFCTASIAPLVWPLLGRTTEPDDAREPPS
ncbi:hypothetical protein NZK35_20095 [Stieleria sp. ICT_E10.1]|uniref:hypothetical protein n=1 Tax=Stieleria sedimenti TaxID=2976331 RepID=UPI0021804A6B|nr:hypothetical protein [Stieleria sedimenti]MCS7468961.1 hypothetical protein [Stieleria sedimenti]